MVTNRVLTRTRRANYKHVGIVKGSTAEKQGHFKNDHTSVLDPGRSFDEVAG